MGNPTQERPMNQRSAWRAVDSHVQGAGDTGKAGEGAAGLPTAALRGRLWGSAVSCPLPENRASHPGAALPEDGPWCHDVNGKGLDEGGNLRQHLNPRYTDNLLQVWI